VYLLDEAMGMTGTGFFSGVLSEQIAQSCCDGSCRSAARSVSEQTGQTVSHTAAWNVIRSLGRRIDAHERQAATLTAAGFIFGTLEMPLLFEEQDGIWLHLQGRPRKAYGSGKEMKLAIAYDGVRKVGKKRYELTNKVACANFESAGKFQKRKEGVIAGTYNTDEIEIRFLNGDGAVWIRRGMADAAVHFQLDPFHRNKAIFSHVCDPDMRREIFRLLYSKQIDDLLAYIEALSNSVEDEDEREHLVTLLTYFTRLVPCHRRGLELPEPPEGKEYRRMGAMESNVFTILGNRVKGRRACWSIDGGNNLARLLCLKTTKKLPETMRFLISYDLPEKYTEEIVTVLTPTKVGKSSGKGYNGFHKTTAPPTPEYKWLKGLGALKPFSEIRSYS